MELCVLWGAGFNGFRQIADDESDVSHPIKMNMIGNFTQIAISWSKMAFLNEHGSVLISSSMRNNKNSEMTGKTYTSLTCVDDHVVALYGDNGIEVLTGGGLKINRKNEESECLLGKTGITSIKSIHGTEQDLVLLGESGALYTLESEGKDLGVSSIAPVICGLPMGAVSCGKEHILLLGQNKQIYSYGGGSRGQLGHGDVTNHATPCLVEALAGVGYTMVAAGGWHSLALSEIGDVWVWGWNESGQLGLPCNQKNTLNQRKTVNLSPNCKRDADIDKEHREDVSVCINQSESGVTDSQSASVCSNQSESGVTDSQSASVCINQSESGVTDSQSASVCINQSESGVTDSQSASVCINQSESGVTDSQSASVCINQSESGVTDSQSASVCINQSESGVTDSQSASVCINQLDSGVTDSQSASVCINQSESGVTDNQSASVCINQLDSGVTDSQSASVCINQSDSGVTDNQSASGCISESDAGVTDNQSALVCISESDSGLTDNQSASVCIGQSDSGVTDNQSASVCISQSDSGVMDNQSASVCIGQSDSGVTDNQSASVCISQSDSGVADNQSATVCNSESNSGVTDNQPTSVCISQSDSGVTDNQPTSVSLNQSASDLTDTANQSDSGSVKLSNTYSYYNNSPSGPASRCLSSGTNVHKDSASLQQRLVQGHLVSMESHIYIQNTSSIQVQSEPCGLDLHDVTVRSISCGSRHTALLTDTGVVLTCGWNKYGQLCQGDRADRDFLQSVHHFVRQNVNVTQVYCGSWNTIIVTDALVKYGVS